MKEQLIKWLDTRIAETKERIAANKEIINAGYKRTKVPVSEAQTIVNEQNGELAAFIECRNQLAR